MDEWQQRRPRTLNWGCYEVSTVIRRDGDCARFGGWGQICSLLLLRDLVSLSTQLVSRMQSFDVSSLIRSTPRVFSDGITTVNVIRTWRSSSRMRPHSQSFTTYHIGTPGRLLVFSLQTRHRSQSRLGVGRNAHDFTIIGP